MKLGRILITAALSASLVGVSAFAANEKADKQAEIRKATQTSLQRFYKSDPTLKGQVEQAPGYGVFTTYGLSFLIGGAGGKGIVHDRATGKDTFMAMAQASAGVQIGASESETLIIFNTAKALHDFVNSGWELGAGGGAGAGMQGKTSGSAVSESVITGALYYTLTKNGLQAGGALAGTKFWKDEALN
jgi:lipid-binding SYLF domain-containing protein